MSVDASSSYDGDLKGSTGGKSICAAGSGTSGGSAGGADNQGGGGGAHGGDGGNGAGSISGGSSYGDALEPITEGSGGGAIVTTSIRGNVTVVIDRCTFIGNIVYRGSGGAINSYTRFSNRHSLYIIYSGAARGVAWGVRWSPK